jgi:hypothetical protein
VEGGGSINLFLDLIRFKAKISPLIEPSMDGDDGLAGLIKDGGVAPEGDCGPSSGCSPASTSLPDWIGCAQRRARSTSPSGEAKRDPIDIAGNLRVSFQTW